MKLWSVSLFLLILGTPFSGHAIDLKYDFWQDTQGWVAGFADYPDGDEKDYQLTAGMFPLPTEVKVPVPSLAYVISGINRSDDLFMYFKKKIGSAEGITPNTRYRVNQATVTVASNAPTNCSGVGGSPGGSVWIKFGMTANEPDTILDDARYRRMNIDKGVQINSGRDAIVLGDVANGIDCDSAGMYPIYKSIQRQLKDSLEVESNSNGEIWLLLGTDSGYESRTTLYYQSIAISLEAI